MGNIVCNGQCMVPQLPEQSWQTVLNSSTQSYTRAMKSNILKYLNNSKTVSPDMEIQISGSNCQFGNRYVFTLPNRYPNKGVIIASDQLFYEGDIINNKAHGKGTLLYRISKQIFVYQGEMRENQCNGQGKLISKSRRFNGQWRNGLPYRGTMSITSQNNQNKTINIKQLSHIALQQYNLDAQFNSNSGVYHYKGDITFSEKYSELMFQFNGSGEMRFPDDSVYRGDWHKNQMHGKGRYQWSNGDYFQGNYQFAYKEGKGKYYIKDVKLIKGIWRADQLSETLEEKFPPLNPQEEQLPKQSISQISGNPSEQIKSSNSSDD